MVISELISLYHVYSEMEQHPAPIQFVDACLANIKLIQPYIDNYAELLKPTAAMIEYNQAVNELARKMADKKDGKSLINRSGQYVITKNRKKYDELIKQLRKEHSQAVEDLANGDKTVKSFMETNVEIDLKMVHKKYLPNVLNMQQRKILDSMLSDSDVEIIKPQLVAK